MASIRNKAPMRIEIESGKSVIATVVTFDGLGDDREHFALLFDGAGSSDVPLIRIHSECVTGDVFGSSRCDCGDQLKEALRRISEVGGVLLYLRQEGRNIGFYNKIDTYVVQDTGVDTFSANESLHLPADGRSYEVAIGILRALSIDKVALLTNNGEKVSALETGGISVVAVRPTGTYLKRDNYRYLKAKAELRAHSLAIGECP